MNTIGYNNLYIYYICKPSLQASLNHNSQWTVPDDPLDRTVIQFFSVHRHDRVRGRYEPDQINS